jgi:hypothetical protein
MFKQRAMVRLVMANPVSLESTGNFVAPSKREAVLERIVHVPVDTPAKSQEQTSKRGTGRHARRTIIAVALAAIALIAAPAFALQHFLAQHKIEFGTSEPAPPIVQKQFNELFNDNAPPDMNPEVEPLSTRGVGDFNIDGRISTLWVAPTKRGGFCMEFTDLGGGCRSTRLPTAIPPSLATDEVQPWLIDAAVMRSLPGSPGTRAIFGSLIAPAAARLELAYEDGTTTAIPFVWVSEPINAGFFVFVVPVTHRAEGGRPSTLTAYDASGKVLARTEESIRAGWRSPPTTTHR